MSLSIDYINQYTPSCELQMEEDMVGDLPYIFDNDRSRLEWKLRLERRTAIFSTLNRSSKFAALTQSSLLVGMTKTGIVISLLPLSNWQSVFTGSEIYRTLKSEKEAKRVLENYKKLPTSAYQRLELAFQSFAAAVMLSVEDIDNSDLLRQIYELKIWFFKTGQTEKGVDYAVGYGKYLCKLAQAIFLKVALPKPLTGYPSPCIYQTCSVFSALRPAIANGVRTFEMTPRTAYMLSQLASFTRAGPYPSKEMVKESVKKTIDLIMSEKTLEKDAAKRHRGGLTRIFERLNMPETTGTHVSLSGSGCLELSREDGGKGKYMADFARTLSQSKIDHPRDIAGMVGLYDCFGSEIVKIEVARSAARHMADGSIPLEWGDVLYMDLIEFSDRKKGEQTVPLHLGRILLLTASADLKQYGSYGFPESPNPIKHPLFRSKGKPVVFEPNITAIPVKAALSIESAGKSRMVTSNPASYTQVGQVINHFMREWLSKDPFCRIGFEESDKLWEVLSSYGRAHDRGTFGKKNEGDM